MCELLFCDSREDSTNPDFQLTHDTSCSPYISPACHQHEASTACFSFYNCCMAGLRFALLQDFFHEILGSRSDVSYRFCAFPLTMTCVELHEALCSSIHSESTPAVGDDTPASGWDSRNSCAQCFRHEPCLSSKNNISLLVFQNDKVRSKSDFEMSHV